MNLVALSSLIFTKLFTGVVRLYQWVHAPFFHGVCRFEPTCSQYAIEAVQVHGVLKGLCLGVRRITKCHPFHPGGFDFVPPREAMHGTCCCKTKVLRDGDLHVQK